MAQLHALPTSGISLLTFRRPTILLGRPALNKIRAVASTRHMKMKLPSLEGAVITIKYDQKEAKKCYENSLKTKRGVFAVTTLPPGKKGSPTQRSQGRNDPSSSEM